jgi:glycosyltransferase involved in cell wall biosynthesis
VNDFATYARTLSPVDVAPVPAVAERSCGEERALRVVERIIILYPGETSSERINNPQNYSLSRLLLYLNRASDAPIYFLNAARRYERYGNIEFLHCSLGNVLSMPFRDVRHRNTLIVNQGHGYSTYAMLLRRALPRSRLLVRIGGVYYGRAFIESPRFDTERRTLRYLRNADMILSTADGTPVDVYMQQLGIAREKYRKWLNGFPDIPNAGGWRRRDQVVCISRLSAEKGIDYVIEAFAEASSDLHRPHKLVIVGDGPQLKALRDLSIRLGVADRVDFVGQADDIARHLYEARLLVSGLANNPIMEAIATGTPVVAVELGETSKLYGRYPNVHIVDYPPGGCGRIDEAHRPALVRDTAARLVRVLNSHHDHEPLAPRPALYGWPERLKAECALYDSLFAPRPASVS